MSAAKDFGTQDSWQHLQDVADRLVCVIGLLLGPSGAPFASLGTPRPPITTLVAAQLCDTTSLLMKSTDGPKIKYASFR